jgi:hypothetical protein
MRKSEVTPREPKEAIDVWDDVPVDPATAKPIPPAPVITAPEYDIDGLMTDFPTATELERFVFDQTGLVLTLKGRANKLKYQVAMDVLNGQDIDAKFIGTDNPYLERADLIPVEAMKEPAPRDPTLPGPDQVQNNFVSRFMAHPDPDFRAQDRKVDCLFRKYKNGMISYEVMGPLDQRPHGEKMDKFGRLRPEIIRWVDPRTGEQVIVRKDGTLTPVGRNIRAVMQTMRINNSNWWDTWIDREFVNVEGGELRNPWALDADTE